MTRAAYEQLLVLLRHAVSDNCPDLQVRRLSKGLARALASWLRLTEPRDSVGCAALMLAGILAAPALADMVDDWFGGKVPPAEPKITYAGEPIQLKFSHPNPPASLVPPIWRNGMNWLQQATKGKLTLKEFGAGTLHGPRDGFKAVRSNISDYATRFTASEARGSR